MPAETDEALHKQQLAANFDAASGGYDRRAVLQQAVARELLERLELMNINPRLVLDLGSGTGGAARALARQYARARVVQTDMAPGMLLQARRRSRRWLSRQLYVCADAEWLPFRDESADLVFSSLMFQWCSDLAAAFAGVQRVLRPEGLFLFATLGPDTLSELRDSWLEAGDSDYRHVNRFHDMHDVGDALVGAGFADPVMETDVITLTYPEVREVLVDLKRLGAANISGGRRPSLTGKQRLARMMQAYEQRRVEGRVPATYEIVYGHAWIPPGPKLARARAGIATIPVETIGRRGE